MTIEIKYVGDTELYQKYPGQNEPQPCDVELDCESGVLSARYNPEIGNAVTFRRWHGFIQAWSIPALKGHSANLLLDTIAPLAERVCDGYESVWDGNNHVAKFDEDADAASLEIERLCENFAGEEVEISAWDAADWLDPVGGPERQAKEFGITAKTTDDEIAEIADRLETEAHGEGVDVLNGTVKHLRWVREQLAEQDDEQETA